MTVEMRNDYDTRFILFSFRIPSSLSIYIPLRHTRQKIDKKLRGTDFQIQTDFKLIWHFTMRFFKPHTTIKVSQFDKQVAFKRQHKPNELITVLRIRDHEHRHFYQTKRQQGDAASCVVVESNKPHTRLSLAYYSRRDLL
jgi:hypothetical protein